MNQPEARPAPPSNPVASRGEEAGPANRTPPVVPYPYPPDEIIGGDSVISIERRLLTKYPPFPSSDLLTIVRIQAQDLFEVKVDIIKLMAGLDPTGDWMGRGARALDNSRTATGEESLDRLYTFLENLKKEGVQSETFENLKAKMIARKRMDLDSYSST